MNENDSMEFVRDEAQTREDDPRGLSNQLWSIYVSEAWLHDKNLVERWKSDMDGILIFAGLFSASVTAFIVESYKDLKTDSANGDTSVALLRDISLQLVAISNGQQAPISMSPTPFQPKPSMFRVNAFWFLSLVFGLVCALAATLVQQWAHSYFQAIERRPTPEKKARIRSYLYLGIETYKMKAVVEAIPALLHISVFLFLAGLLDFLIVLSRGIAFTILSIISIFAGLYIIITFLPTVRQHSPYRTPLSHVVWRVLQALGLLRYINPEGKYTRIPGSMTEGRETLATECLPGRTQRDAAALRWTLESLTVDSQLELFIEGLSGFMTTLSDTSSHAIVGLTTDAMRHISMLLQACKHPSALAEEAKLRRVMICTNTFLCIIGIVGMEEWNLDWLVSIYSTKKTLSTLKKDQADPISNISTSTMDAITGKLVAGIVTWTKRPDPVQSLSDQWRARDQVVVALNGLDILNSLDAIIEMIPSLVQSRNCSTSEAERFRLGELLSQCQEDYIPQRLTACRYQVTRIQQKPRERCAIACMNALRVMASDLHFHIASAQALAILKSDNTPIIAQYANCTTAHIACQVQLGIVHSVLISPHKESFLKCCLTLDALHILDSLRESNVYTELQQQLTLGQNFESIHTSPSAIWTGMLEMREDQHTPVPPDEIQYLNELRLRISNGATTSECSLSLKLALTRGRTVILIALLQYIVNSPIDESGLEITLETLRFITKSMLARFSSRNAQALLVELLGKATRKLHFDFSGSKLAKTIVGVLFDTLSTIGDPRSIVNAQTVINDYLKSQPNFEPALNALYQLQGTIPLTPLN